jgi:hypothetical protein
MSRPLPMATAEQVAPRIGVSASRLLELAELGYAPHVLIDGQGPPLFYRQEIMEWAKVTLWRHSPGKAFPTELLVITDQPLLHAPPAAIAMLTPLRQYPMQPPVCVVYFLVADNEVVYVGQSVYLPGRIEEHRKAKKFDRVYYIAVPREHLDAVETAFIRQLKPRLNGNGGPASRVDGQQTIAPFLLPPSEARP